MNSQKGSVFVGVLAGLLVGAVLLLGLSLTAQAPKTVTPPSGSVASADIYSPYLAVNGVVHWYTRVAMRQASTTLCSVPTPPATSTITKVAAHIASGNAYSNVFAWGYASNAFATTTAIGPNVTISAAYGDFIATTTLSTQTTGDGIVYPGNYVNFKISTSSASATYAPIGDCIVDFLQLQ